MHFAANSLGQFLTKGYILKSLITSHVTIFGKDSSIIPSQIDLDQLGSLILFWNELSGEISGELA